jgi:hypothetical protein
VFQGFTYVAPNVFEELYTDGLTSTQARLSRSRGRYGEGGLD